MSIKTIGSIEADSYKVTSGGASVEGFVTNDAAGLLEYGQGGAGTPVGAAIWDIIEHKNVATDTGSLTFSGLSGDTDKLYKLVFRNLMIPKVVEITDAANYISGNDLVPGETVLGGSSGVTAIVDSFVAAAVGNPGSVLTVVSPSGTFDSGEVITGNDSNFSVTEGGQFIPDTHYLMKPNNVTTNQRTTFQKQQSFATVQSTFSEMTFMVAEESLASGIVYFFAESGKSRTFYADSSWASAAVATNMGLFASFGHWTDTAANLSSLVISSSLNNNGISAGSLFSLYSINN